MKNKLNILSCILAVVLCMTAFSSVVSAVGNGYFASNENESEIPPEYIDNITVSTEDVAISENKDSESLTPDGNMNLIDDILQNDSFESVESELKEKQFITVQTKNGNYFYLVIDRDGDSENVYFLNLVDEDDLLSLMEDEGIETEPAICLCDNKCVIGKINTECEICFVNLNKCIGEEITVDTETDHDDTVDDKPEINGVTVIVIVLILALIIGAIVYWLKSKPQNASLQNDDFDDYDLDEQDEEYDPDEDDE